MNIGDKKDEDSRLSAEPESDLTSAETRIMPVSPNDGVTGSSEDYESPKRVVPIPAVEFEELNAAWQQSDPTLKKTLPPFDPDSLPFRSASYSDGSFDLRSLESQPKNGRVARWIFVALGALILLLLIVIAGVGIYWYTRRPIETTKTAAIADAPATSDPFGSALASLVKLSFIDSNGKPTGETNGFYVADQMVVCSLAAMRNSIRGYATLAGQNSNFEVAGISSINPENGLALVRISSLKAPLLPLPSALPSENQAAAGEQVIIIVDNSSINNRINATITGFRVEDGLMMLKANNDSSHLTRALDGSPVLNKSGEVVAMMTHDETDAVLAVSLSSIKKLVDGARGEYTLAAAGATDVFYDFRSDFRGARSDVVKNDEIPEDTREGVLRAIFGDKLNNRDECFSPQILSAANGSFTSANGGVGAQTAYIIG
ncbi:MAG: hypothetical protein ACRD4L_11055, partial [Pyrinomonadaceae bacterium]